MIPVFLLIAMIIFLLFTIVLAAAKTVLFIKNIGEKRLAWWFFFPRYIVIPSSKMGRRAKEQQNKLSAILFFTQYCAGFRGHTPRTALEPDQHGYGKDYFPRWTGQYRQPRCINCTLFGRFTTGKPGQPAAQDKRGLAKKYNDRERLCRPGTFPQ